MQNILEIASIVRGNITFISEETEKIQSSDQTKAKVRETCSKTSEIISSVLKKIGTVENRELRTELKEAIENFHPIVESIKENEDEKPMFMLLITHVGDMLNAVQ
jgi:hypothetical protein